MIFLSTFGRVFIFRMMLAFVLKIGLNEQGWGGRNLITESKTTPIIFLINKCIKEMGGRELTQLPYEVFVHVFLAPYQI